MIDKCDMHKCNKLRPSLPERHLRIDRQTQRQWWTDSDDEEEAEEDTVAERKRERE